MNIFIRKAPKVFLHMVKIANNYAKTHCVVIWFSFNRHITHSLSIAIQLSDHLQENAISDCRQKLMLCKQRFILNSRLKQVKLFYFQ